MSDDDIEKLKDFAKEEKIVAIGEIGLDYYYDFSPREQQKLWFARQINLAKELNLPIIVHDRDAHKDVLDIVKAEQAKDVGECSTAIREVLRCLRMCWKQLLHFSGRNTDIQKCKKGC